MPGWYVAAGVALSMYYNAQQGSSTTSYQSSDPEAAARLATIAEAQQGMAEDAWAIYKEDALPYQQAVIEKNMELIDPQGKLLGAQLRAEERLTDYREEATKASLNQMVRDLEEGRPVKTEMLEQQLAQLEAEGRLLSDRERLAKAGLEEAVADLREGRPLKQAQLGQQLKEIQLAAPATEKFYKESVEGVSAEEERGKASADVEQTYGQGLKEARRDLARAGVAPGSKKYQEMMADMIYQKAKAGAGARTRATRYAGEESFRRLGGAMSVKGRPGGLQPPTGYTASGAMAGATGKGLAGVESMGRWAPGATPYGQPGMPQATGETGGLATQLMGGAAQTSAAGLRPQTETKDWRETGYGIQIGGQQSF